MIEKVVESWHRFLAGELPEVNGIDIIRCDATGRIVEFRVMIRPLQAVNAVHEQMRAVLASRQP